MGALAVVGGRTKLPPIGDQRFCSFYAQVHDTHVRRRETDTGTKGMEKNGRQLAA